MIIFANFLLILTEGDRVFKMSTEITKYRKNYRNIYGFEFATVKNFSDSILAPGNDAEEGILRNAKNITKKTKDIFIFCPLRWGEGGGTNLSGLFPLKDFFDCPHLKSRNNKQILKKL